MKYAIIESGGKQFKAVEGGLIDVDRLPVEAGANVKLEQVLLLADGENVTVGTPTIKGETVWAKALEHVKGPKVTIFNYRPKKRIRVKTGHRQNYTRLLIQQVGGSELTVKEEPKAEKPAKQEQAETKEAKAEKKAAAKPAASPKGKAEKAVKAEKKAAPKPAASPKGKAAPKAKPAPKAVKKTSEKKSK